MSFTLKLLIQECQYQTLTCNRNKTLNFHQFPYPFTPLTMNQLLLMNIFL